MVMIMTRKGNEKEFEVSEQMMNNFSLKSAFTARGTAVNVKTFLFSLH